jgi:cell volume regulation protein A
MNFTAENVLLIGAILLVVSIVISKTGYRFGVPTLLSFLLVGMGFGSDGLGLQFSDVAQAQFIGMLALCIILFSGGMDTKLRDIRPVISQGIVLSTLGVLLTTLFTGLFIYWISNLSFTNIHFSLMVSLLLAATMSSTDSASVFNILRSQRMNLRHNLRPTLELESGSNDPMAFMLTVVLIQLIQTGGMSPWGLLWTFVLQFAVGSVAGFVLGKAIVWTLNKINLSNTSLYPLLLLGFAFLTYAVTYYAQGNGYLAVYIAGIVVGNARIVHRREIATFFDGMTWLFQITMFLTLGLLVNPHEMLDVTAVAVLISICMIFLARPLSVFVCLLPYSRQQINLSSRLFISWVGLRGAAPIIFATYPVVAGIEGSRQIFNIVFFITLLSLLVQGTTISPLARRLHLDEPLHDDGNSFGLELPDEMSSQLQELIVTPTLLAQGDTLKEVALPDKALVMMVRRGGKHIVPDGKLQLQAGDVLLLIKSI